MSFVGRIILDGKRYGGTNKLERFKNILIIAVKRSAPVYLVSNFAKKKRSSDLVTLVSGGLSCNKSGKDLPDSLLLQLGRPENGD